MSRQYTEYVGSMTSPSSCGDYNTLSTYHDQTMGRPAIPRGTTSGVYVVPNYSAPGYNTLSHDVQGDCKAYFNIDSAYRSKGGSCNTKFVRRMC